MNQAHASAISHRAAVRPWEGVALEAAGSVIEFWGFKRNQGRVWALLYLRGTPMTATTIQQQLDLSKGAVSILMRELEQWAVVRRVRVPGQRAWHYEAGQDLMAMIRRVFEEREVRLVRSVLTDLERAETMAREDPGATRAEIERLTRMRQVATGVDRALRVFLDTARLDAGRAVEALRAGSARWRGRGLLRRGR
jgi:DNA-binding transcriptional regulator GbsR (MarR family)